MITQFLIDTYSKDYSNSDFSSLKDYLNNNCDSVIFSAPSPLVNPLDMVEPGGGGAGENSATNGFFWKKILPNGYWCKTYVGATVFFDPISKELTSRTHAYTHVDSTNMPYPVSAGIEQGNSSAGMGMYVAWFIPRSYITFNGEYRYLENKTQFTVTSIGEQAQAIYLGSW